MRHANRQWVVALCGLAAAMVWAVAATAQVPHVGSQRALAHNVIVPQSRSSAGGTHAAVQVTGVDVGVVVLEQVATTTMDIAVTNPTGRRQEAELVVPVPDGAVVRSFTFSGAGSEPSAEVLPKADAKGVYESIVAKIRDPALLEFVGYNLIRTAVFPVDAGGVQKVRLTYEHLLPADGDRVDYCLPRSEAVDYTVPWHVSVRIKSRRPIATVYSPSHEIEVTRKGESIVSARIAERATTEPGAFRLSYLMGRAEVAATLLAYPDPGEGGGYFLLLAGLPPRAEKPGEGIQREVTLVLDRSGSMRGEKLDQVREAALQILAGLADGETMNILTYNEQVDFFAARPVPKSTETFKRAADYLASIQAAGGTNLHDALFEALRQPPTEGHLPIVLFLTDGLPTIGQTSEAAITRLATEANPHKRRVFTFGVGVDVNTPLLDKVAVETRATATYVLPKEDVELKVAQVFRRLAGPVLADPQLTAATDTSIRLDPVHGVARVRDVMPGKLPDLFEGDQLVVLGRYVGDKPLEFTLKGNYLGKARTFRFTLGLEQASTRNAFVPRLWASRKIAVLTDAIRALGADPAAHAAGAGVEPRLKELTDEIVRLSTKFGILTEYTAFLAREGTDLSKRDQVLAEAVGNFKNRAVATRSGMGSVNQSVNYESQRVQSWGNARNAYFDQNMNRVEIATVQQVNDRAFYRRGNRWIDSSVAAAATTVEPKTVIDFGTEEFKRLVDRLAREGRQGTVSMSGEIVIVVDGEPVLIRTPAGR